MLIILHFKYSDFQTKTNAVKNILFAPADIHVAILQINFLPTYDFALTLLYITEVNKLISQILFRITIFLTTTILFTLK